MLGGMFTAKTPHPSRLARLGLTRSTCFPFLAADLHSAADWGLNTDLAAW